MANQKKGFVMYFDSLGLLTLFPPVQIGELLLALYDYDDRICDTEESPEAALLRYPALEGPTQVGFCSIAGHILRDTRKWKQRQQNCQQSALERHRRAREEPAPQPKQEAPRPPCPQQREAPRDFRQERRQEPPARTSRSQQPCIPEAEMARYVRAFQDSHQRSHREADDWESPYFK